MQNVYKFETHYLSNDFTNDFFLKIHQFTEWTEIIIKENVLQQ